LFQGATICLLLAACFAATAAAAPNPPDNLKMGEMPRSCQVPTSVSCENAAIYYLDQARAATGLGPYLLPQGFPELSPDRQMFILSNLDRIAYGIVPVAGLETQLSSDAARGVAVGDDPLPSGGGWSGYNSNWAGAYVNTPAAYFEWMYDDGYGSGNLACQRPSDGGCWGHRQNILVDRSTDEYGGTESEYEYAMGAATGHEQRTNERGYAMLIISGYSLEPRPYYYTWPEAQAIGAGTNPYDPGLPDLSQPEPPQAPRLRFQFRGARVRVLADPVLYGHTARFAIRRERVPCGLILHARICHWVKAGPVKHWSARD
jgi:hypothetical protein